MEYVKQISIKIYFHLIFLKTGQKNGKIRGKKIVKKLGNQGFDYLLFFSFLLVDDFWIITRWSHKANLGILMPNDEISLKMAF